jgi:hypothetical protein
LRLLPTTVIPPFRSREPRGRQVACTATEFFTPGSTVRRIRRLHSASNVVLPKPAGAETTVNSRRATSSGASRRGADEPRHSDDNGHVELGPEYLPFHGFRFCHLENCTQYPAKAGTVPTARPTRLAGHSYSRSWDIARLGTARLGGRRWRTRRTPISGRGACPSWGGSSCAITPGHRFLDPGSGATGGSRRIRQGRTSPRRAPDGRNCSAMLWCHLALIDRRLLGRIVVTSRRAGSRTRSRAH